MVCNTCNTQLRPFKYVGYYDTHYGYRCNCVTLPNYELEVGAYGTANLEEADADVYFAEDRKQLGIS